ncbi:zinc knuckle [Cooperia oncophora]
MREWPEYVQLLSMLHRSDLRKAYSEIKQLAITTEQSRTMYGTLRSDKKEKDLEARKCFSCLKVGHIARICLLGRPTVNKIKEKKTRVDCMSEIKAYPILCDDPSPWV